MNNKKNGMGNMCLWWAYFNISLKDKGLKSWKSKQVLTVIYNVEYRRVTPSYNNLLEMVSLRV